jgi:hypothetical protein
MLASAVVAEIKPSVVTCPRHLTIYNGRMKNDEREGDKQQNDWRAE